MRASFGAAILATLLVLPSGCRKKEALAPWLTMPTVATHARWIPIGPADVHGAPVGQSPSCDGCHFDKGTGLPSHTFQTWTCTGCHVAVRPGLMHDTPADMIALHAAVPEYAAAVAAQAPNVASLNGGIGPQTAEDGACRGCHPAGWAVNHGKVFPVPHQDASGLQVATCFDCHLDAANRSSLGCSACHPHDFAATATAHVSVPDFQAADSAKPQATIIAASALCARCHADATVPVTVAGHPAASGGFLLANAHVGQAGGACLDCHKASRTDKPFAADFKAFSCGTACHGVVPVTSAGAHDDPVALGSFHATTGVDFAGKVAALGFDAACLSCHPAGAAGLPANHPFPVGATLSHPASPCMDCHATFATPTLATAFNCGSASCHTGTTTLAARHDVPPALFTIGYADTSDQCLWCHGDSQVNRTADHDTGDGTPLQTPLVTEHETAGCRTCHPTARLDKPFAADWTQRTCTTGTCHPGGVGP